MSEETTDELSTWEYWDNRYRDERTGWDLGRAPAWLEERALSLSPRDVLVVGSGHGHDARAWAQARHSVLGLDFAPRAIAAAREASTDVPAERLRFVQGDVFELGRGALAPMAQAFDLVWEQTCLCAIEPSRRAEYFEAIQRVLRPGGQWHAILWSHHQPGGPPFHLDSGIIEQEIPRRFRRLSLRRIEEAQSSRPSQELVEYSLQDTR